MAPKRRENDSRRVPFVNGVRVTPQGSHFEGSRWAPERGEGIVPGGKDGAMIAERIHKQNVETRGRATEKFNQMAREKGNTKVVKINTDPTKKD